jgi:peptide/nickel transport system substrate-binding protein
LAELGEPLRAGGISRRKFMAGAGALGASAMALGGCSTRPSTSGSKGSGIIVALDGDIGPIDPNAFKSNSGYLVCANVYETLSIFGDRTASDGSFIATSAIDPLIAKNYQLTGSGSAYSFAIRNGVRFSNGTPVTAQTVVDSYNRALKYSGVSALMMGLLRVTSESQLRATGPMTFELELDGPNPMAGRILPLSVLNVLDQSVTSAHATSSDPEADGFYASQSMGTGPYVQSTTEWVSGSHYMLERNPHYWNPGKVRNSSVLLQYIPSPSDQVLALERGDIDVALSLPVSSLVKLKSNPNVRIWKFTAPTVNFLSMNALVKPFDDVRVRQAIAWAMPYKDLINSVWHGYARPINSIFPVGMPTSLDTWNYTTDLSTAQGLMDSAGFSHGFATTLGVSTSSAESQQAAVWIQSSLAKIGIKVSINPLSDAVFRQKEGTTELPMVLDDWYSWVNDPYYQAYFMLHSKSAPGTNISNYKNPQVDQLIEQGEYTTNSALRTANSHKIQQIFAQDVPRVLLYQQDYVVATRANVHGIDFYPDELQRLWQLWKS